MRVGEVFHIHVVALLLAGARDGDRLHPPAPPGRTGPRQALPHPRPVGDAVAQDGELLPVHLPVAVHEQFRRELGRHVHVPGAAQVDGGVLGQLTRPLASRRTPRPCWPAAPARTAVPGGLQHPGGAFHVEPDRPTGSAATSLTSDAPARWNTAAQPARAAREPGLVEQVQFVVLGGRDCASAAHVDHPHLVPRPDKPVHHMGADEPATPDLPHTCMPVAHRPVRASCTAVTAGQHLIHLASVIVRMHRQADVPWPPCLRPPGSGGPAYSASTGCRCSGRS